MGIDAGKQVGEPRDVPRIANGPADHVANHQHVEPMLQPAAVVEHRQRIFAALLESGRTAFLVVDDRVPLLDALATVDVDAIDEPAKTERPAAVQGQRHRFLAVELGALSLGHEPDRGLEGHRPRAGLSAIPFLHPQKRP